jgi:hypothetical protein
MQGVDMTPLHVKSSSQIEKKYAHTIQWKSPQVARNCLALRGSDRSVGQRERFCGNL